MSAKKILWWLLLLFGEAVLITAFILFRGESPANVLILNIVVSSLIFDLFFLSYQIPWIDLQNKSQKQIGALGISWYVVWIYSTAAFVTMLVSNLLFDFSFSSQLIIHAVLLFFLLLGIWFSSRTADKVQEVHEQETQNRSRIAEMKAEMRNLKDKMSETDGLPEYFTKRIEALDESLRFISPNNNAEANEMECTFIATLNEIKFAISNFSMNEERIENNLKKAERIYRNRKNIYSN